MPFFLPEYGNFYQSFFSVSNVIIDMYLLVDVQKDISRLRCLKMYASSLFFLTENKPLLLSETFPEYSVLHEEKSTEI